MNTTPLLRARDVVVDFPVRRFRAQPIRVLHGVSAEIRAGKTLGLVGESGSGKSTFGRTLLGLTPPTSGTIEFRGNDISQRSRAEQKRLAREIQVIFQDPYSSLNPSLSVVDILTEPLIAAGTSKRDATKKIHDLLDHVGLPANAGERLPREFSGGQRQRIAIARALAVEPEVIVCDEPVSALDLSTQLKILDLLIDIQNETGVAYLFITHDIGAVRYISHDISVMYRGDIVEHGSADAVIDDPQKDYTKRLMLAAPTADPALQAERRELRRQLAAR